MRGWVKFTLFMIAIHSIAVVATIYVGRQTFSSELPYTEAADAYRERMRDIWLEMGIPTWVSGSAAANTIEIAETNASETDGVVNTNDLRYAIVFRFVDKRTADNTTQAYTRDLCPAEERLGIEFGIAPWTDEDEWGFMCP